MRNSKFLSAATGKLKFSLAVGRALEFFFAAAARNCEFVSATTKTFRFLSAAAIGSRKVFLAASFLFFISPNARAQLQMNDSERQLFESLNHERTTQGLSALQWDNALFKAARHRPLLRDRREHRCRFESADHSRRMDGFPRPPQKHSQSAAHGCRHRGGARARGTVRCSGFFAGRRRFECGAAGTKGGFLSQCERIPNNRGGAGCCAKNLREGNRI